MLSDLQETRLSGQSGRTYAFGRTVSMCLVLLTQTNADINLVYSGPSTTLRWFTVTNHSRINSFSEPFNALRRLLPNPSRRVGVGGFPRFSPLEGSWFELKT